MIKKVCIGILLLGITFGLTACGGKPQPKKVKKENAFAWIEEKEKKYGKDWLLIENAEKWWTYPAKDKAVIAEWIIKDEPRKYKYFDKEKLKDMIKHAKRLFEKYIIASNYTKIYGEKLDEVKFSCDEQVKIVNELQTTFRYTIDNISSVNNLTIEDFRKLFTCPRAQYAFTKNAFDRNKSEWYFVFDNHYKHFLAELIGDNPGIIGRSTNIREKVQKLSEEEQLEALKFVECRDRGAHFLDYINNPTEQVMLTAVVLCPYSIKHIKNPPKKIKLMAYGSTTVEKPNFKASDKNIEISVVNGEIEIKNKTNKFLTVLSMAEYQGKDVYSLSGLSLPPRTAKKVFSPKKDLLITVDNVLKDKYVKFGYAIEYKVGNNGSVKNLYHVKKYLPKKLL